MAEETVFRGVISFLDRLGVYDVILPFLLVFTVIYAILEKTKVLGVVGKYKTGDDMYREYGNRNLNAIVAFVVAFLVIASTQLVAMINEAMANIVVLVLVAVSVLMLVGVFFGDKEFIFDKEHWGTWLMIGFMVLGVLLIFLQAIPVEDGDQSALEWFYDFMEENWSSEAVASLILIGGVVVFMYFITMPPTKRDDEKGKKTGKKPGEV